MLHPTVTGSAKFILVHVVAFSLEEKNKYSMYSCVCTQTFTAKIYTLDLLFESHIINTRKQRKNFHRGESR